MSERQRSWEINADQIRLALANNEQQRAVEIFVRLHPGDQVEVFDLLGDDVSNLLLQHLGIVETAHLFNRQEDSETLEAAEGLPIERLADVLEMMEPDEAADLLGDLPKEQASKAIDEMEDVEDVLALLPYPDETAGGRMTTDFIATNLNTTAEEAIEYLRSSNPDQEVPYYLFVKDIEGSLVGVVGLRELIVSGRSTSMEKIMNTAVIFVTADTDQEQVAQEMARYDLSALPVVNDNQQIIGVITHDDILDVITQEATEDVYKLANVGDVKLEPDSPIKEHLKGRLP